MYLVKRDPEQGFSFPIADLALPMLYHEVVQPPELLGVMESVQT